MYMAECSLSKSGKAVASEWTTLAAIVHHCCKSKDLSVVSLASGTKCVTGARSLIDSDIITDCHAESLLKRAFKRFLISKFAKSVIANNALHRQVYAQDQQIVQEAQHLERHYEVNYVTDGDNEKEEDGDYYMFVSQLPCGTVDRYEGGPSLGPESLYQIHRKPGKGEPCLKASCTDKLAKWLIMGLQGRNMMRLVHKPIKLKGIVIGNCVRVHEFDRNLFATRICSSSPSSVDPLAVNVPSHLFQPVTDLCILFDESFRKECLTRDPGKRACPSAIVCWIDDSELKVEVIVAGRRQGLNCKTRSSSNKLLIASDVINSDIEAIVSGMTNKSGKTSKQMQVYGEIWQSLLLTERFVGYRRTKC